jgi:hypothetical protein
MTTVATVAAIAAAWTAAPLAVGAYLMRGRDL